MKNLLYKIQKWWQGEYIPETIEDIFDDPTADELNFQRPWLAKVLVPVGIFLKKEWKWAVYIILTIVGLYIAYLKL